MLMLSRRVLIRPKYVFSPHFYSMGLNLWDQELSSTVKHKIEDHWREKVTSPDFDENDTTKNKYYVLSMFPYPSGFLHMGHVRVYTISDTIARYQRMNGRNVIHPIGWDAFGLPAENAAIERKITPDKWTIENIAHMKKQLEKLGCSFDWMREFATCDPQYYRWTQELFLKFYDAGLVYQREALVNWDPVDQTVLADEQVDENGCSWRSGVKVEKRVLKQWFVRTTAFAKDLLEGLDDPILDDWRDIVKLQQHWIGECNGVKFDFNIKNSNDDYFTLWTPTPEYVEYTAFVALNSNHILSKKLDLANFEGTKKLDLFVVNPFNNKEIPVFVTNEIEYAPLTDSYLGIPHISEEAKRFAENHNLLYTTCAIYSESDKSKKQKDICDKARHLNIGGYWTSSNLRDWLISRQRYWGTPIPIVYCTNCGVQPVPREQLPVVLPTVTEMPEKSNSVLSENSEWRNTTCPKCSGQAKRETDTMDTFVDSSWYFLRYIDPKNDKEMFSKEKAKKMLPVDLYIGGKEHAVLHLYYARFVNHFLYSLGLLPEREPFKKLLVQGMVNGRSYRLKGTGQYLPENKVNIIDAKKNKAVCKDTGAPVTMSWEKMSKSKYNGVDPEDTFREYGTDTSRLLILADVAPRSHRNWNSNTFPGILNWQKRLWLTIKDFLKHRNNPPNMIPNDQFTTHDDFMFDSRNYYAKEITFNYLVAQQLSVAISKQQGLTNSIRKAPPAVYAHSLQFERALAVQILMLYPMAPFFAAELWSGFVSAPGRLNNTEEILWDKSVSDQKWPEADMNYNLDLVCQVNGDRKAIVKVPRKELDILSKEEATIKALQLQAVQDHIASRSIKDIKYILYTGLEAVVNVQTEKQIESNKEEVVN